MKRTGQSKIAVVGWGRGMGHKGHMYLADAVIQQAKVMNADPYFFVSKTVGKDDPIFPEEKVKIYQKVFPQHATIFAPEGNLNQALTELAQQGYQGVVVVVGADQKQAFQYLEKPNKEGVPVYQTMGLKKLRVISRQETPSQYAQEEGPRATPMREILLSPDASEQDKFKVWRRDMPEQLSDEMVLELMHKAESRMLGAKPVAKTPKVNAMKKVTNKPLAESIQSNPNEVAELLYKVKPEIFSRFGDDFVMDAITKACEQHQGSAQEVAHTVVDILKQGVSEGLGDTIAKKAKQFGRYMTEPNTPHNSQVRSRAKNIDMIRKKEALKSVFEKDPEAKREFERAGGYEAGIDVMGWQVGWAAARLAKGDTMKQAFQKLYYGGGSSFPFSERAFKLAWVAYNKHYGPEAAIEEAYDHNAPFNAADFNRHMEQLRAREELRKTDPVKALVGDLIDKDNAARNVKKKPQDDDSIGINDPRHPGWGALHNPLGEDSELPIQHHKSPYEGSDDEHRYTTMFLASPNSAQRFAKHIISNGGKARIGKRGQDYYVYHNMPMSKEDWRKSEQQGLEESPEEALKYATKAHAGQTRSGGDPYITHPMRVADHIKKYKQSHNLDALISAAYLHDTIEDTDTTQEVLHDLFGGLVASLVKELTSDPEQIKKMGKAAYLSHKMAVMSSYGLVIKLADRLDNVKDITTAKTPEWRQKYAKETNQILDYIEKTRALSGTHKKLIELIRAKLAEIDNPPQVADEGISRRGILKGIAGAGALGAAGKASAIAGAIPTPSHQAAMYKAAADSNRAEAKRQAELKAKDDAERLQKNTDQVDKEQRVNHHKLDEFAPGNGDDGLPYAEYQVYQCNPEDQFDWIGGPLYQTDNMGMAHKYAYEKYVKHRPKAFMVWQERSQGSRGNYGVKGQSDHNEDDLNEDYLDEK